jgi:VPDSG-CTERM motif
MKRFKYIATLTLAIAALTTHADATPITYSYVGANFTSGTGPAGFTTSDNITASFTVNNLLAPNMTFDLTSIGATMRTISNGVYTLECLGFVTTDASGNIVSWGLTREDLVSGGALVRLESVNDINLGIGDLARRFNLDMTQNAASNGVSGNWSSGPSVPDAGPTVMLLGVALTGLGLVRRYLR